MIARNASIVIDAGHGGTARAGNSSAYGVRGPGGALEKDLMLALAQRVAAHYGSGVTLTRAADVNLPLAQRTAVAQRLGSAVFVSLHANAGPPGARGAEAYVHELGTARSLSLADSIQRELGAYGHAIAPVSREHLAVLSPDRLPPQTAACLLEVDYLSDPYGERRLADPSSLDRLGAAIARGIRRYMGSQPATAEGQVVQGAVIVGIIGLAVATFSLINALSQRNAGGLTWSRNISKVTHDYPPPHVQPTTWQECTWTLLNIDCTSGLSSASAVFNVNWRANGNDIEDCRVEKGNSSDWGTSRLTAQFEGVDAASLEHDSVGCIMMHIEGTLDPAGTGDIDFHGGALIKADGTLENYDGLTVSRGDPSDFTISTLDIGAGWLMKKR